MRCFCFPSIFENSHFWKQKFVIFIIFLEMFQNPKSWCFLFQPQFRNVLKATNNSLYPFFQDFPEFEVLEINKFLFSLANLKFSFFLQISNLEIPFYRIPILPGKISKSLSFRLEIESHFTEIPFYREHTVGFSGAGPREFDPLGDHFLIQRGRLLFKLENNCLVLRFAT